MKTLPTALAAHYATRTTTTAVALRITRADGQVFGLTSAMLPETIDGVLYQAARGLAESELQASAGYAVDNMEMTVLNDGQLFTEAAVRGGVWRAAQYLFFRYKRGAPADGIDPITAGVLGNIEFRTADVRVELRGLQQFLQQPIGNVTSRTCRARFADWPAANQNNRCRLNAASFTTAATVSAVASAQVFTSASAWAARGTVDWFGEGVLTWTGGDNIGAQVKVKTYESGGVFTLMLPAAQPVQVGDSFSVVAGCQGRFTEECKTKFSNVLNFQGEPHLPGVDALTVVPEVDV